MIDPAEIRRRREALGWTQLRLAAEINCRPETVENWETGKHQPHLVMREALARALKCSVDDLMAAAGA